jgi:hypothetical protein
VKKWRENKGITKEDVNWYLNVRLQHNTSPTKMERVVTWCDEQYDLNAPCWNWLFLERNPDISRRTLRLGKNLWRVYHKGENLALKWLQRYESDRSYESKIGFLYEHIIIADLTPILKNRGIQIYYNTKGIAEFDRYESKKIGNRVEVRFFTEDLLNPNSRIGPIFRDFLIKNSSSQVAFDLTISPNFVKKIKKYTYEITSLLIISPTGNQGQHFINPQARLLSLSEVVRHNWLNLDYESRLNLKIDLQRCQGALWDGPDSTALKNLQTLVSIKWNAVRKDLLEYGSSKCYKKRVIAQINAQFALGKVPIEFQIIMRDLKKSGKLFDALMFKSVC